MEANFCKFTAGHGEDVEKKRDGSKKPLHFDACVMTSPRDSRMLIDFCNQNNEVRVGRLLEEMRSEERFWGLQKCGFMEL